MQSEVLSESNARQPTFQVVKVTRNAIPDLAQWPVTGWRGYYHWFAADRGPDSSAIQSGDLLRIAVWDNQENSLLANNGALVTEMPAMTVSSTGKVFMPYVGEVTVRGLTRELARRRIQESLSEIAPTAQVQLSVEQGHKNSVDLVGGVNAPGTYPLPTRNTTIQSVLARAGGINDSLRNPLVRLQRRGKTYEIRADVLLADASRNVRIRGGDQISVVEDRRSFNVLGAAGTQSVIYFEKEHMSAMEALSAMGGLNSSRADPKGILILREYAPDDLTPGPGGPDMQQVVFTIELTSADGLFAARQFRINPQDTLLATESPVTSIQTIMGLFGTLVGMGSTVNNLSN